MIKTHKIEEVSFPRLMIRNDNNDIVLFNTRTSGMIIDSKDELKIGSYHTELDINLYSDFNGIIELENGENF